MPHCYLRVAHLTIRVPRGTGRTAPELREFARACAREVLRGAAAAAAGRTGAAHLDALTAGPVGLDSAAARGTGDRIAAEIRRHLDVRGRA